MLHLVKQVLPSSRMAKCMAKIQFKTGTSSRIRQLPNINKSFDLFGPLHTKIGWNLPSPNCNQIRVLMCYLETILSLILRCVAALLSTVLCNLCAQLLQLLRCQVGSKLSHNAIVALEKVEIRQLGNSYFFTHGLQTVYSSIHR